MTEASGPFTTTSTAPPATASGRKKKKTPTVGPVRYNLEAFGTAILGAVLLKWFCIEAYAIPTSSMQPTLMGSNEAGVYDRLLVDKFSHVVRDPQRWDVTVFGYPLQKNQSYVKRILGMPGETLYVGGGNVYRMVDKGGESVYETLRKPAHVQAGLWKEVYPLRQQIRDLDKAISNFFHALPRNAWKEGDAPGEFTVDLQASRPSYYQLQFQTDDDGGFINRVFDGYPVEIARAIREKAGQDTFDIVPDARIAATFTPADVVSELRLEVGVRRPQHDPVNFGLLVKEGSGKLVVTAGDDTILEESAGFVCELPAGVGTELAFAHVDDELIAWRDGDEVMRLDVTTFACRTGCELSGARSTNNHEVTPQIRLKGKGVVDISGLQLARDLHYTNRGGGLDIFTQPVTIPAGHYFMMGDNTLQSIDSRGWTALTIGVDENANAVPPDTPGARKVRGNLRPRQPSQPPDRDETPVLVASRDKMAMINEFGDVLALNAQAGATYLNSTCSGTPPFMLQHADNQGGSTEWVPPKEWVPFVPREHIRGRALLIFWRSWPQLSPIR